MKLHLPDPNLLQKTGEVDYYYWNYQFPIKYIQRIRFKAILKLMGDKIYDKLLEIGTGSGIFLPELSRHSQNLYAIDIHDKMEAVEKLCKATSIDVKIDRCPIENTPYQDEMFDIIIAVSVLEFVGELNKALSEIRRLLKPNGIFLTICPQQSKLLDFFLSVYSTKSPDEEFINPRKEMSRILETHFKVIKKEIYPPILGKVLPVYSCYKLCK